MTSSAADQLSCTAHCQYSGKGEFQPVWVDMLEGGGGRVLTIRGGASGAGGLLRELPLKGCSVAAPKSQRKGHPHAFRLDCSAGSGGGSNGKKLDTKFIFSVSTAAECTRWMASLSQYSGKP